MSEKTEEPTDQKLRKAREEGQVAKSQDLAIAGSMLAVVVTLFALAESATDRIRRVVRTGLDFGNGDLPMIEIYKRMGAMALEALIVIGPISIVAALGAAIGLLSHVGVLVAMKAVSPKFENLDPAAGVKRIFSMKSLITFLQMVFKALVLGIVLWQVIVGLLPMIAGAAYQSTNSIATIAWGAVSKVLTIALGLFIVLGPFDYGIQKWQFIKGQRMSKDDIKREFKEQEGDPHVKGQRKQLAHEIANSSPRDNVASANAVLVNPTHYAVAVRYRPDEVGLPIVVAKGVDEEALRIRRYAEEAGVPIFANPPLARALHKVPLASSVPEELFEPVAAVLRWVDEVGRRAADHQQA
ncbi:type III secretion system export apparatus subunit SctU [Caldimonas brevitalea]|uniref:Type III secretion protein U n=1 Tax=Caldimonas brevitalea TaxID=413882 RepID=A0A0G3BIM6_9BURK|nr:type III secretion system export apparatus subunit SctU [Caldimonas brevitalea]AKJ27818.1 type III secretion protein U [Caldimonas brevitalea]